MSLLVSSITDSGVWVNFGAGGSFGYPVAILAVVVSDPVDGFGILCCLGNNRKIAASRLTGARVKQTRRKRSKENRNFLSDARVGNGGRGKGGEEE